MKLKDGWYAKDSDQDIYWYGEMPEKGNSCWNTRASVRLSACIQIDGPWEDSLHKVEDGVITKIHTFKKDQKVLVSNGGENWLRRHYGRYKDGKHIVFQNGTTSWTVVGIIAYKFIKSAEEE